MDIKEPDTCFLQGKTIRLRALEPEDLDLLYQLENDTAHWEHGAANVPYSHAALRQYLSENQSNIYLDGQVRLVIEEIESGTAMGCIDLFDYSARHQRAEIGIAVLPEYRRRGLARQALDLLLHYAFSFLGLHQVYAYVAETNMPSCRLFHEAGFVYSALLPDWICVGIAYRNVILYTKISPFASR